MIEATAARRKLTSFTVVDYLSLSFSALFVLMFLAEYLFNAPSDDFSNYYRTLYGLLPTLLPLLLRWTPLHWWASYKAGLAFSLMCLLWYAYLSRLAYDSYNYLALTSIAILAVVFLCCFDPYERSPVRPGAPRLRLPGRMIGPQLLLILVGTTAFAAMVYAESGIGVLWILGLLLIRFTWRMRWRSWKGLAVSALAGFVLLLYVLPILTDGQAGLELVDGDAYGENKARLSPALFAFLFRYFLETNLFAVNDRVANIFLPNAGASEFQFAGDFGWLEYVFAFGLLALLALVFNVWSFLRALRLPPAFAPFAGICLWWTLLVLNAHYGIFFNPIGLVGFVLMLFGLKALGAALQAGRNPS